MYELTCPSCKRAARFSFVRVGASVACGSCDQRYVIESEHVRRREPVHKPPSEHAPSPEHPTPPKVDADGNVVGLSGLSQVMKHEHHSASPSHPAPAAPTSATPAPPKPLPQAQQGPGLGGRAMARVQYRRRRLKSWRFILLFLLGAILIFGVSALFVWWNQKLVSPDPALLHDHFDAPSDHTEPAIPLIVDE